MAGFVNQSRMSNAAISSLERPSPRTGSLFEPKLPVSGLKPRPTIGHGRTQCANLTQRMIIGKAVYGRKRTLKLGQHGLSSLLPEGGAVFPLSLIFRHWSMNVPSPDSEVTLNSSRSLATS